MDLKYIKNIIMHNPSKFLKNSNHDIPYLEYALEEDQDKRLDPTDPKNYDNEDDNVWFNDNDDDVSFID